MRKAKLILLIGLILTVTGTAGALTHIPFRQDWPEVPGTQEPIYCHIVDHASGTVYLPAYTPAAGGGAAPEGVWLDPDDLVSLPGLSLRPGEDSWGIFEVDLIRKGTFNSFGDIVPLGGDDILYAAGDQGTELVGIYRNRQDIGVKFNPGGSFEIQFVGDEYDVYLQDFDVFDDGNAGSGGRNLGTGDYATIGDDASSVLVLDGYSPTGFYPDTGLGLPEGINTFYPSGTNPGRVDAYIQLNDPGVGTDNERFDTDYFIGSENGNTADFRLQATITTNNGFNAGASAYTDELGTVWPSWVDTLGARWDASTQLQTAYPDRQDYIDEFEDYDWTSDSSDPLTSGVNFIPEPLTMAGVFLAVSGLGGYLRKRRRD
jgi:hypothetical protein